MSRVLLLLVCSAIGCASTKTTFSATSSAAAPAIPASKVKVIDLRHDKPVQLPDGVGIKNRWSYHTRDVELVPGVPNAEQPHQRIGDFQVEVRITTTRPRPSATASCAPARSVRAGPATSPLAHRCRTTC